MVKNIKINRIIKNGEELIINIDILLDDLKNLSKVGIFDILSEHLLPTIIKRKRLNKIKDKFTLLNNELEKFNQDIKYLDIKELNLADTTFIENTKQIDYFLGVIGNIYTQSKISEAIKQLEILRENIIYIIKNLKKTYN